MWDITEPLVGGVDDGVWDEKAVVGARLNDDWGVMGVDGAYVGPLCCAKFC